MLRMPLAVGDVFAGYTILRVLGAGGMGTVYLAQHPRLPRHDALKVLSAELTADPEFRARFVREADIAASLWHPNIVGIHDRGESDGQFWISMDFVAGTDAARLLHERYPAGMPVGLAREIVTAVGSALDHAHERGLLHRDVKPANILISDPGTGSQRVFLADFGIARPVDDASGLTATNMGLGTFAYAAPEQLMGETIDGRADQYALACSAFHLLTGRQPYDSSSSAAVIAKHVTAPPPLLSERRPELAPLDSAFTTAMAKRPAERFTRCRDFAQQLLNGGASPTQPAPQAAFGPPTQYAPTQAAALFAPTPPTPPVGRRSARRTGVLVGAIAAAVLVVAGGTVAVVKLTAHQPPPAAAPKAALSPGPFTGTYRADYAPHADLQAPTAEPGKPLLPTTWGVRSVCRPTGCVATATRLGGEPTTLSTMVFDDIGGQWVAVGTGTSECNNGTIEIFVVMTLKPRPDGTLVGENTKLSGAQCAGKSSVTFTRTGDVDSASVADPAALPARVVSPAEALRGRYRETTQYPNRTKDELDWTVHTDCLRTGERCMSFFRAPPNQGRPLVFGNGTWVMAVEFDGQCDAGGPMHYKRTASYSLPQPRQDPITLLTGHGHYAQTGACASSSEFDDTFQRTGD